MPRLLIVTRHTPLPWEDGAGAYLHALARFLVAKGLRVDVLWLAPHEHLRWRFLWWRSRAFDPGVRLHLPDGIRLGRCHIFPAVVWLPFKARCLGLVRRCLEQTGLLPPRARPPLPPAPPWASPPTPTELALVQRFTTRHRPDVVLANYAWMCPIFDLPALAAVRRACLAHDIGWKRAALAAPGAVPEMSRADESAWLQRARLLITISEADAVELHALAPAAEVVIAPMAIEPHRPLAAAPASSRLLFVGSDNAFNAEGLDWFLREVWPTIRRANPAASLHVCGSIHRAIVQRPEGVTFHGPVPQLADHYRDAALVIVPLLRATGLNIKLVDAAGFGRAIITTPATLVGAPFLRDAVAVAETAAGFAAIATQLLASPADRAALADRALAAVTTHLAPDTCYAPVATAVHAPA